MTHPTPQSTRVRWASALLMAGGLLSIVAGAAHGDLPEGSGEAALTFVADHPAYSLVHMLSIVGAISCAAGLRLASDLFQRRRELAEVGATIATVGASIISVQFALDGFGLPAMARHFVEADATGQATLGRAAVLIADGLVGLALLWVIVLYGLTVAVMGVAAMAEWPHVRAVGLAGVAIGAWTTFVSSAVALGSGIVPDWLAFVSGIIAGNLVFVGLGVVLRRGAPSLSEVRAPGLT